MRLRRAKPAPVVLLPRVVAPEPPRDMRTDEQKATDQARLAKAWGLR